MKWGKTAAVVFGAITITALGIDAADTLNGSKGTLLSQVIKVDTNECPDGMLKVENMPSLSCVDAYEASTGSECPVADPDNLIGSLKNLETPTCLAESRADVVPWRFITRDQAMQACARVGKRLPTSDEWYQLSLGLTAVHESCNISSGTLAKAGLYPSCVTPHGAHDFVGNVWEWVSDDVANGVYRERQLPETGFVTQVDQGGVAVTTSNTEDELFGKDYFWSRSDGVFGMIRGGYYDSGTDAGIYTVHADTLPTAASAGVGFRCVK